MKLFADTRTRINGAADAIRDQAPQIARSMNSFRALATVTAVSLVVIAVTLIALVRRTSNVAAVA